MREINAILAGSTFVLVNQHIKTYVSVRYKYELKKIHEIERLRFSKHKQFWKYFKKDKSRVNTDVSVEEFSEYFSQLGNENSNHVNQDAESFCDNTNFKDNPTGVYEGLNDPISITELLMAVKNLKQGKAAETLLNEYFIERRYSLLTCV